MAKKPHDPFAVFDKPENKPFDWNAHENVNQVASVGYLLAEGSRHNIEKWYTSLRPEHFEEPILAKMYEVMIALHDSGIGENDNLTFYTKLVDEMRKTYFDFGYHILWNIHTRTTGLIDPRDYINGVIADFRKRTLKAVGDAQTVEEAEALFFKSQQVVKNEDEFTTYRKVIESVYEKAKAGEQIHSTGLRKLDEVMGGGLHAGKSYCIAARPAHGKTLMLGTVAYNMNEAGIPVLFMATEMGKNQIAKRLMSKRLNCFPSEFNSLKNGQLWQRTTDYAVSAPDNIVFADVPFVTIDQICAKVRKAHKQYGIKGFFFDYLGAQTIGGKDARTSEAEHQGLAAQKMAELCTELEIWALYSCQLNRENSLLGSDGALRAADQVLLQEKTDSRDSEGCETLWLKMAKTRYTSAQDIGSKELPVLRINKFRPFIEEC